MFVGAPDFATHASRQIFYLGILDLLKRNLNFLLGNHFHTTVLEQVVAPWKLLARIWRSSFTIYKSLLLLSFVSSIPQRFYMYWCMYFRTVSSRKWGLRWPGCTWECTLAHTSQNSPFSVTDILFFFWFSRAVLLHSPMAFWRFPFYALSLSLSSFSCRLFCFKVTQLKPFRIPKGSLFLFLYPLDLFQRSNNAVHFAASVGKSYVLIWRSEKKRRENTGNQSVRKAKIGGEGQTRI